VAYLVIEASPRLGARARRKVAVVGPPAVLSRSDYESMMRTAGFTDIEAVDLTDEYQVTLLDWHDRYLEREAEVVEAIGREAFDEKVEVGEAAAEAIGSGLLRRRLYVGQRPA